MKISIWVCIQNNQDMLGIERSSIILLFFYLCQISSPPTSLISLLAPRYWIISFRIACPFLSTVSTSSNISLSDSVGWASENTSYFITDTKNENTCNHTHFQNPEINRTAVVRNKSLRRVTTNVADYPFFSPLFTPKTCNCLSHLNFTDDVRTKPSPNITLLYTTTDKTAGCMLQNWLDITVGCG